MDKSGDVINEIGIIYKYKSFSSLRFFKDNRMNFIQNDNFLLDKQLEQDTSWLGDLPLSRLLLHRADFSDWIILVPRINGLRELHELNVIQQQAFIAESCIIADLIQTVTHADKINTAAIGNIVSQLHIHYVARFTNDACWPKPIWGNLNVPFRSDQAQKNSIQKWLGHLTNAKNLHFKRNTH